MDFSSISSSSIASLSFFNFSIFSHDVDEVEQNIGSIVLGWYKTLFVISISFWKFIIAARANYAFSLFSII
jgi:hypothetical protein